MKTTSSALVFTALLALVTVATTQADTLSVIAPRSAASAALAPSVLTTTPQNQSDRLQPLADGPAEGKKYPLKGEVVDVHTDKKALLVKHEAIPDVMRAMTMLLKTDDSTLASVKKGDAITGMLVKKSDGWWIESVKVAK